MKRIALSICLILIFSIASPGYSLEGFDNDTGDYVEIDNDDILRPGNCIIIYDASDRAYHEVEVISLTRHDMPELEVFDIETDEYRTFELLDIDPIKA